MPFERFGMKILSLDNHKWGLYILGMKVLIACEESQVVCKAFRLRGHEAYSCDIQDCSGGHPEWHIKDDVFNHLNDGWGLMIFHWPCTFMLLSGVKHFKDAPTNASPGKIYGEARRQKMIEHANCFHRLLNCSIPKIAGENPIMCSEARAIVGRKYDQIIRPNQFGDDSTKGTCLWLKNLPKLKPTNQIIASRYISKSGRSWDKWFFQSSLIQDLDERSKFRSKTFPGIAAAMAAQWG